MTANTSKVIALSKALPKWTDIRGRQIFTSIVRDPIAGPLEIIADGVKDNATAVHTEHLLAFNAEHYDFWAHELKTPREDWNWAWWGENLTVTGLNEEDLRIGDIIRAGDAEFQVTSPRIPCFKVAWRIGQPDSILPRLMETGRVGFHLEVLRPGHVSLNDRLEIVSSSPDNITVADLSRLLLSSSIDDVPKLKAAAAIPALGTKAAGSVRHRITLIEDRARLSIGRWRGWRRFTVTDIKDEAHEVRSFYIHPEDEDLLAPPAAGQFLSIKTEREDEPDIVRPWSISDVDLDSRHYRLSIKAIEGGAGSHRMHQHLQVGHALWARPPAGQFVLDRSGYRRIALVSAGIGVTPVLSMLKAHVERDVGAPPLVWIHVAKNGLHHAFRGEVDALLKDVPKIQRLVYYTQPDSDDRLGVDYDRAGRPTKEDLAELFGAKYLLNPFGRELPFPGQETEVYICGPESFQALVRDSLETIGVKPGLIRSETFVVGGPMASGAAAEVERATVVFRKSGITAEWYADDAQSLLDLAEAAGLDPPYACRTGICQSCQCGLLSGTVQYDPNPSAALEPGTVLICCARPNTDRIELDL